MIANGLREIEECPYGVDKNRFNHEKPTFNPDKIASKRPTLNIECWTHVTIFAWKNRSMRVA